MYNFELNLNLRYTHSVGDMAPYFDGLLRGHAVASQCSQCNRRWFPPKLACCADAGSMTWEPLSGLGTTVSVTAGSGVVAFSGSPPGQALGLIQMAGADNLALGWLKNLDIAHAVGIQVRMVRNTEAFVHPAQAAVFVPA